MPQVFVVPALGLVRFAATGPVAGKNICHTHCSIFTSCCLSAGSFAAFIQSLIGSVAASSLFAGVQGVAMGAAVSAFIKVIAGGVSTFLAALLTAIFLQGNK